jgi:maltose alpha-D-glucosyltransferase / alpha-amylase
MDGNENLKSRLLNAEQSNTSIIYGDKAYLKLYRKVDYDINPDEEMTRLLSEELSFEHVPRFYGSIEWYSKSGIITLGMLQELVSNHGDAWQYMLDKVAVYNDKVMAMPASELPSKERWGTLTDPCRFEDLPDNLKELLDPAVAEKVRLLGLRTAEMHLKFASVTEHAAFRPEPYSLHYQRSLFSSFNTSIRESFDSLEKHKQSISEKLLPMAEKLLSLRASILDSMKKVYSHKMELLKIRIHGDYHLGQVLFTGKDLMILDFEGEPAKRYSERRLKFSALRDVAGMIRSFNYAGYGSLFLEGQARQADIAILEPYAELWSHYMSGFFMAAYLEKVKGTLLVPDNKEDLKTMMDVFLLSKVFYELNYELNNRPDWLIIPIKGILNIHINNPPEHECNEHDKEKENRR